MLLISQKQQRCLEVQSLALLQQERLMFVRYHLCALLIWIQIPISIHSTVSVCLLMCLGMCTIWGHQLLLDQGLCDSNKNALLMCKKQLIMRKGPQSFRNSSSASSIILFQLSVIDVVDFFLSILGLYPQMKYYMKKEYNICWE